MQENETKEPLQKQSPKDVLELRKWCYSQFNDSMGLSSPDAKVAEARKLEEYITSPLDKLSSQNFLSALGELIASMPFPHGAGVIEPLTSPAISPAEQAATEDAVTKLAESTAVQFIQDIERTLHMAKLLFARLLKRSSTYKRRTVLIDLPSTESSNVWSVALFTDRVYADESYSPRSLEGALTVAECLLNGTKPPQKYTSF